MANRKTKDKTTIEKKKAIADASFDYEMKIFRELQTLPMEKVTNKTSLADQISNRAIALRAQWGLLNDLAKAKDDGEKEKVIEKGLEELIDEWLPEET